MSYGHWTQDERDLITASMQNICEGYRLFDERAAATEIIMICRKHGITEENMLVNTREILRRDLCRDCAVPEAWIWLFFWRMLSGQRYDPDPWFEIKWWLWLQVRGKSKAVNFLGCQNSIKSFFKAWFGVVQGFVWDSDCRGFISGPQKMDTEDKIWNEFKDFFEEVLSIHGEEFLEKIFNCQINVTDMEITFKANESGKGTGFIKFIASQKSSAIRGIKTKKHKNPRIGIIFVQIDEYSENIHTNFSKGWNNVKSNPNAVLLLGTNPDPDMVNHADLIKYIDPLTLKKSNMERKTHFVWQTAPGLVARFEELNCPNFLLGRTEYHYMLNQTRKDNMEHDTEAEKAAQLFAWPFGAGGVDSLTDAARQYAAGVFTPFLYESSNRERILALDPSFGGTDPAVYTIIETGPITYQGQPTEPITRMIGIEQAEITGIVDGFVIDADLWQKIQGIVKYRIQTLSHTSELNWLKDLKVGDSIEGAGHCAILAADLCILKGVPFSNVTFDSSQRGSCADWIFKVFGRESFVWYYEGSRNLVQEESGSPAWIKWPYRTFEDNSGTRYEKWSDTTVNTISMLWQFACSIANEGMLVNGSTVQKGLDELQTRAYGKNASGKLQVASKADIKKGRFQGALIPKMKSPAWAETLAMAIYFACRFKNQINLGSLPQFETNEGSSGDAVEEWLDLHQMYG